ncbi:hypothetical protein EEL31_01795 [Brevibacillus laterosporus]|nr:hypothetical protein [Brevibacillus laterosporus]TPG73136.1 hypothetical protein EEL31_01795 [Brevibacillus laterosporus]
MDKDQIYYQYVWITNLINKVSFIAHNIAGMTVKDTENYVKINCSLPADTFNIIVLGNNHLNQLEADKVKDELHLFVSSRYVLYVP